MTQDGSHHRLFELIDSLHRHGSTIAVSRAATDVLATSIATMRARIALRELLALAANVPQEIRATVDLAVKDHERLLGRTIVISSLGDAARIVRWLERSEPTEIDLFETSVRNRHMGMHGFEQLRIVSSSFVEVGLAGSSFDDAILEDCDFRMSDLSCTSWLRARVTRCRFANASLVDSTLDRARFVDCTFRGVDFGAAKYGPRVTARQTDFVRADLRETGWQERILAGTKFNSCSFSGIHGRPLLEGVEIEAPDLSVGADGSNVGTARDILAAWYKIGVGHWPN